MHMRQGGEKFSFCRTNFLGIKTLQVIAGLKRQLLELLSANCFVPRGMRARAVEGLGRRVDGSDGAHALYCFLDSIATKPTARQLLKLFVHNAVATSDCLTKYLFKVAGRYPIECQNSLILIASIYALVLSLVTGEGALDL